MRIRSALIILLSLFLSLSAKAQLNTEQVMIIGRNALYFEDYVLSIQYFNRVITARPYLHEPYFYRGLAKYNLDDFVGAEEDLSLSIERNPYVSRSYQLRGLCRANLDKYPEAESDFKMAIKYDPQNPALWQNWAVTAIKQENWENAAHVIDSMLAFSPRNTDAYILRSKVALQQEDTIMAHRMIDEALICDKYSPDVYSTRAMLYAEQERYEEAEKDMDYVIELLPGRSNSYISRALVRYYRNNLRGAMDDYNTALNIDSHNFYGYYNRGLLRMQVGEDNLAIKDFDKVLDIDPDNTMARFNRALLRDNTGDMDGAIADYSRVIEDYPNFEYGYLRRAAAYRKMGQNKKAETDEVWLLKRQMAIATGDIARQDTVSGKDDKVRKRSDRNMRNYNKMVVADDEQEKQYATSYRGKVQNRNVYVELQPMFTITYYEQPVEVSSVIHYYKPVEDINKSKFFERTVLLTNNERALSEDEVTRHFAGIDEHSKSISDDPESLSARLARAMDFYLVQDFASAINDLNIAFTLEGEMWLVYFMRAAVRYKYLEWQHAAEDSKSNEFDIRRNNSLPDIDFHLVKSDLDMVISQMPDFAHAYYNRANVFAKLSDFKSAVVDYDKAIEIDDKLADAYYNRGLVKIYLGNIDEGISDLSKAGELGIYSAYNAIKRFADKEIPVK